LAVTLLLLVDYAAPLVSPTRFPYTTLFRSQQVWAEFLHYYRQGEKWYLSPSELAQLNEHNRNYEAADPVKDRILGAYDWDADKRSEEHTSELQSRFDLVCRLLLEKQKQDHT